VDHVGTGGLEANRNAGRHHHAVVGQLRLFTALDRLAGGSMLEITSNPPLSG
jgi:hypothetical protein